MTFDLIRQWAADRNLIEGATPQAQFVKLMEEAGELAAGIAKSRHAAVVDGIGDMVVVLTILAAQHNVTIEDCMAVAYNEIKDRKGRMVNGCFVKDADLLTPPDDVLNKDGWIEWGGGERPVHGFTRVEVRFRNGARETANADHWRWVHADDRAINNDFDIVAYRVLS